MRCQDEDPCKICVVDDQASQADMVMDRAEVADHNMDKAISDRLYEALHGIQLGDTIG